MKRLRCAILVVAVGLAVPLVWATPAFAARSLTVTPSSGLIDRQIVTIDGTGFNPNTEVGFCQAIDDGTPDQSDCNGGSFGTVVASPSGDFSAQTTVRRLINVPSAGRTVNCASESCFIGAAETNNLPGTATFAPIAFAPGQPDGRIKRRSDGAITGDNVYGDDGSGQTRIRAVEPGTKWTFALQVQNDGLSTDDIKVTAPPSSSPFTVRYFFSYFNITSSVTGSGFTFTGQVPGQIQTFAVQFTVDPGALVDSRADLLVTFTSSSAGSTDAVRVGVVVRSAT
jgi:hypothetical protein